MRSFAILLVLLASPLAARADDAPWPSSAFSPTYLTREPAPQFLCDSAVAEDCFRILAPRLTRDMTERDEGLCPSVPSTVKKPACDLDDR